MKSTEFPALACIAMRRGERVGVVRSYMANMLCERGARREERVGVAQRVNQAVFLPVFSTAHFARPLIIWRGG